MRTQSDIKKLPECGRSRRGRAGGALIDVYISKTLTLILTPNQPHTGMLCILCHITAPCCLPAPGWVGWRRALPLLHHSLPLAGVAVHKMVGRVREALGGDFSELVQEAVHALADQDEARLAKFDVAVIDVAIWVLDAAHDGMHCLCSASACAYAHANAVAL